MLQSAHCNFCFLFDPIFLFVVGLEFMVALWNSDKGRRAKCAPRHGPYSGNGSHRAAHRVYWWTIQGDEHER